MIAVREATPDEAAGWESAWTARTTAWFRAYAGPGDWGPVQTAWKRAHLQPDLHVFVVSAGSVEVGQLVLSTGGGPAAIVDIHVELRARRRGIGTEIRMWAETWARERAGQLWAMTDPGDAAVSALFAGYPLKAQWMIKDLSRTGSLPDGVTGAVMTDDEFARWRELTIEQYAAAIAGYTSGSVDEARPAAIRETDALVPDAQRTTGHALWTVRDGDDRVGTVWIKLHLQPPLSFVFDVVVDEPYRGRGYGRAAMTVGEQIALAGGDTHMALNVFADNPAAIRLYERMSYVAVEQRRALDLS